MIKLSKPLFQDEEISSVVKILKSGNLAQGKKVKEFEEKFAEYTGVKYAAATCNGTTALYCALLSGGVGKGGEVITTPFTFIATVNSILMANAKPVFVDIDEKTFNINIKLIEDVITPKTKAIVPIHLFGHACEMDMINDIAEKYNLIVIEDACQAHGAEFKDKKVGSFGDIGCFSFYPTKNITTGEGGIITTNNKELMIKIKELRNHGSLIRDKYDKLGYNFRMTNINAAIGVEQLKRLEEFNERRIKNATYLTNKLNSIHGIITPHIEKNRRHVFNQYTVRVTSDFGLSRDELMRRLKENGIESKVYYPIPVHKQGLYRKQSYSLPITEKVTEEVLSLPVHPKLSISDLNKITEVIKQ